MEFQLLLPTSKLVPIHTTKEQFALMMVPMQVPAQPGLSPVDFFLVGMTREHPFATSLVARHGCSRIRSWADLPSLPLVQQHLLIHRDPKEHRRKISTWSTELSPAAKGGDQERFQKKKRKIEHRKHLCLSSVQVYFSNTSHTTNISVWLLRQNRRKEK